MNDSSEKMRAKLRIGVLLSGGGRTLQNLLDQIDAGALDAKVVRVISDREKAYGLDRARTAGIPVAIAKDPTTTLDLLRQDHVDLVCLCGYLRLLEITSDFADRVLNIHPSLLPKYGGRGFYGDKVHAAVIQDGDRESGCTVHFCSSAYDEGPILLQKRVPVLPDDNVESLAARVFAAECEAYPEAIRLWQQQRDSASC